MTCFYMEAKNVYACDQCEAKDTCSVRVELSVATTRINTLVHGNRLIAEEKDTYKKTLTKMYDEVNRWKGESARMLDQWIDAKMEIKRLEKEAEDRTEVFKALVDKIFDAKMDKNEKPL
jgi:hypothetical protein